MMAEHRHAHARIGVTLLFVGTADTSAALCSVSGGANRSCRTFLGERDTGCGQTESPEQDHKKTEQMQNVRPERRNVDNARGVHSTSVIQGTEDPFEEKVCFDDLPSKFWFCRTGSERKRGMGFEREANLRGGAMRSWRHGRGAAREGDAFAGSRPPRRQQAGGFHLGRPRLGLPFPWRVLETLRYDCLGKRDNGLVKGLRPQDDRFLKSPAHPVHRPAAKDGGHPGPPPANASWRRYAPRNAAVLTEVVAAYDRLSGPATNEVVLRQHEVWNVGSTWLPTCRTGT